MLMLNKSLPVMDVKVIYGKVSSYFQRPKKKKSDIVSHNFPPEVSDRLKKYI